MNRIISLITDMFHSLYDSHQTGQESSAASIRMAPFQLKAGCCDKHPSIFCSESSTASQRKYRQGHCGRDPAKDSVFNWVRTSPEVPYALHLLTLASPNLHWSLQSHVVMTMLARVAFPETDVSKQNCWCNLSEISSFNFEATHEYPVVIHMLQVIAAQYTQSSPLNKTLSTSVRYKICTQR